MLWCCGVVVEVDVGSKEVARHSPSIGLGTPSVIGSMAW